MATLNVTEYANLSEDRNGTIMPVAKEPSLRSFNVTYTTSTASDTLKKGTRFVRLIADADAHIEFGESPTATATSTRLEANIAEYFGVDGSQTLKIAAYDGSS